MSIHKSHESRRHEAVSGFSKANGFFDTINQPVFNPLSSCNYTQKKRGGYTND